MTSRLVFVDDNSFKIENFASLVRERRSVRGFLDRRVPDDILKAVFDTARWAPSGTNVQPWHVCVASGEVCEALRQGFLDTVRVCIKDHVDCTAT